MLSSPFQNFIYVKLVCVGKENDTLEKFSKSESCCKSKGINKKIDRMKKKRRVEKSTRQNFAIKLSVVD